MAKSKHDITTVEEGDVRVRKLVDTNRFDVPSVVFNITSSADDEVTVDLVQEIPDGHRSGEVGFHPEHGAEHWEAGDSTVTFSRAFEPGEQFVTVLGTLSDDAPIETWLSLDVRLSVTPLSSPDESGVDAPTAESGAAEPDAEPPESETPISPDTKSAAGPPSESDASTEGTYDFPPITDSEPGRQAAGSPPDREDPVGRLADAIREGDYDDADLEVISEQFGAPMSLGTKVEHLQSMVSDFAAYKETLEAFIDKHGEGEELAELTEQLQDVQRMSRSNATSIADLAQDLDERAEAHESLDSELDAVRAELGDRSDRVETNAEQLQQARSVIEDLRDDLADLQTALGELDTFANRLDSVDSKLERIDEEVQEATAFQERLSQTFGDAE